MSITCNYHVQLSDPPAGSPKCQNGGHNIISGAGAGWLLGSPGRLCAGSCNDFPLECLLRWKFRLDHIPRSCSGSCQAPCASLLPDVSPAGSQTSGPLWGVLLRRRVHMEGSPGAACVWESGWGRGWGSSVSCAAWPSGRAPCSPSPYSLGQEGCPPHARVRDPAPQGVHAESTW